MVADAVEFEWDADNIKHLKRHHVSPEEFEEVILSDPLDLGYENENGEERYRSMGVTRTGRLLIAVWTPRQGRIRAITAFPAGASHRKTYWKAREP